MTTVPFPPPALMQRVAGVTSVDDFDSHARAIFSAVSKASPVPLLSFGSILDFGVGCGRLARMFESYTGHYVGADVDQEAVEWVAASLPWVTPAVTTPLAPLPFADGQFDCVISVSVFTHMNERDAEFYLGELRRVSKPNGTLLISVHGRKSIDRALSDPNLRQTINILDSSIEQARQDIDDGKFFFARQDTHSTDAYEYGISFTSEPYIRKAWSKHFKVRKVIAGAIHDFQDIAVLTPTRTFWRDLLSRLVGALHDQNRRTRAWVSPRSAKQQHF